MASFLHSDTTLHTAIRNGQLELLKACLEQKLPSNVCELLHLAVSYDQVKIARFLMTSYDCLVDCRNKKQQTSLHVACSKGHLNMIRILISEYQASLTLSDKNDDTPLHEAARCGQTEIVSCLIREFGCNPRLKGTKGKTILHHACQQGHAELVEALLTQHELEVTLLYTDADGNIPLHDAAMSGNRSILKSLTTKYKCPVGLKNHDGLTPIHIACINGHSMEIVKLLVIDYKASDEYRCIYEAAQHGGPSEVLLCLIQKFGCNPNTKCFDGKIIFHYACHQGYAELIEYLLTQYGPDLLFASDDTGNTPLHYAAMGGNERVTMLLINKYNCRLSSENNNKETPLDIACDKGHFGLVRLMVVKLKADLICDAHIVAWYGYTIAMKRLIEMLGKNPQIQNFVCNCNDQLTLSSGDKSICNAMGLYRCRPHLTDIHKRASLLLTRYDSKRALSSIIRIFVTEHSATFNLHKQNSDACGPIYEGVWCGNTLAIEFLIKKFYSLPTFKVIDGTFILLLTIKKGFIELIMTLLMQYKIDPLFTDNDGNTPLHYAAWSGREDIVKLLITKYYHDTANVLDEDNDTPLHIAAWHGHINVVNCLIDDFFCNPNTKGFEGRTILHHACHQGHVKLVEILLTVYNLDIACVDDSGCTVLHLAALGGSEQVTDLLITKYHCPVDSMNNTNETPLHLACANGHLEVVQKLVIDHGANLNSCDSNNDTPLHKAATHGQIDIINCLINEFGCNSNVKGYEGRTILHHACHQGHIELVEALLRHYNLDPLSIDNNGYTPLHLAAISKTNAVILVTKYGRSLQGSNGCNMLHLVCQQGDFELVQQLVTDYKFHPMSVDDDGNTPLHYAALSGKSEVATMLVTKYGSSIDHNNYKKETPLHLACIQGQLTFIQMLVTKHKADVNTHDINNHTPLQTAVLSGQTEVVSCFIKNFNCSADVKGTNGCSLLHLACQEGHLELAEQLVTDYKLDPMIVDDNGNTPLHYAVLNEKNEVATVLITKYGSPVNHQNNKKETPLHLACTNGQLTFIQTLVTEHKADISSHDINNHTPLQRAVMSGQTEVVNCFIKEFNCSIDVKGTNGCNLLHLACHGGHLELAEQLVTDYKLDPMIVDDNGNTLLHYAALTGKSEVATMLIMKYDSRVMINYQNIKNETPLHLACTNGHLTFIQTLVTEHEADISSHDINNHTPLQRAVMSGQTEVVNCFIKEFNCSIDVKGTNGCNLLHLACHGGHLELAEQLVTDYKLDPMIVDDNGNTPLHYAALTGKSEVATMLMMKNDFCINYQNNEKETPLHLACTEGQLRFIRSFMTKHKKTINISARDINSCTPLQRAVLSGQTEVVNCLIKEFNCSGGVKGINGSSLLHLACQQGHLELVEQLVMQHNLDLLSVDDNGYTPLHLAAIGGRKSFGEVLINKYGQSVKGINGCNMLHLVCQQGDFELIKQLVTDCKFDPMIVDDDRNTPLHYAALGGRVEVATMLIKNYGSLVNHLNNDNETPLHLACTRGHLAFIQTLVMEYKANINTHNINNHTPLQRAVLCGQAKVVECFIKELNCHIEDKGPNGCSLLHLACQEGHLELAELLVTKYKLDPMIVDDNGNTPLHYAALGGKSKVTTMLIVRYGSPVNHQNNEKETPLHLACTKEQLLSLNCIHTLVIVHKADINTLDINNHTPLQRAVLSGQTEVVKCFIENFNCSADVKGTNGCSLLHLACQEGHPELAEQLVIDYKLDPMIVDDNGNTPLHYAALGGMSEVATQLITKYDSHVNNLNNDNETPLHLACARGHLTFIQTLVMKHKADINTCDINNHTPLKRAVLSAQAEVVNFLIKDLNCSADIKRTNSCGLLHLACQEGHLKLINQLVTDYNLDPMIGDDNGNTPLHYAALSDKSEVATLLIAKYGSPVNVINKTGETPLHLACTKGHLVFVRTLLVEHTADINTQDINNHTPLQRAALSGQTEVVFSLILEFGCDPKITGVQGRNLLHYACLNNHDVLARKLVDCFHFSLISADVNGNSPLHISATFGQNKCVHMLLHTYHAPVYLRNNSGKSALEIASDVVTKNIIETYLKEDYDKIQYDYKELQNLSKKKYSGAQRLTRVFVLGNVQSGKSTLIESLKRQGFFSSFNQVSEATVPPHTCGIIPSEYSHKSIGRVVYYDFAGDSEYYSSHSAIMSSVMQSEGTNICLILVNYQKDDKCILEELCYWFGFISYHCTKLKENCKVLTVGSHIDLITKDEAKKKAALVSEFIENYLSHASKVSIEVVKGKSDLIIKCCKPRSSSSVYSTLNQLVRGTSTFRLSEEAAILLGLLEKDFKNVVTCKIQTLLTQIMQTGVYLPNTADSLYPTIMELHTIGLLLIIESMSGKLEDHLLLLNVPKLTNEVHKLIFSKDSAKRNVSSIDPHSVSMGILPQTYINSILPEYITTECLIQLQYCQELSHAEVKLDYSVITTEDFCAPRLLYFPALCETERKKSIKTPDNYDYSIGWYIKCIGEYDYLPPRFLHVLLVRLAHTLALPAADATTTVHQYNRRCTMWKNGIHWLMEEGVECYVEMVSNSKGIVIITKSEEAHKSMCTEILFKIIQEIHQAKEEFCGTVILQEYLINSNDPTAFTKEDKLFSTCDIARVLQEGKSYVVSTSGQGHTQLNAAKISHLLKYVHWDAENNKGTLAPIEDIPPAAPEQLQITCTKLCEQNHSVLYAKLTENSAKWREIGTHLGFRPSELDEIQARPSLYATAPKSLLSAMLAEWLQWSPGDQRGSTKCATLEELSDALNKAGLAEPAQSIMTLDLTA